MKFVGELKCKDFYKFNFHCKFIFASCLITIKKILLFVSYNFTHLYKDTSLIMDPKIIIIIVIILHIIFLQCKMQLSHSCSKLSY